MLLGTVPNAHPQTISLPGPTTHTQLLFLGIRLQPVTCMMKISNHVRMKKPCSGSTNALGLPQIIAVFSSSPPVGQFTMLLHTKAALMQLVPFPFPVPVQSNCPAGQESTR